MSASMQMILKRAKKSNLLFPPRDPDPKWRLHYALQDADDAWSTELRRLFGKRAGDVRYTEKGRGAPGSKRRKLHDAFAEASEAQHRQFVAHRGGK